MSFSPSPGSTIGGYKLKPLRVENCGHKAFLTGSPSLKRTLAVYGLARILGE